MAAGGDGEAGAERECVHSGGAARRPPARFGGCRRRCTAACWVGGEIVPLVCAPFSHPRAIVCCRSQEWLREAELKHCRVCMLAFVGFIFTDFYTLPGFEYTTLEAHDACVASGAMSQLLLWIGLLEVVSFISIDQMLRGSGRDAGDFGFDPIGFSSDPKVKEQMQMKELANGRLAMFACGGVITQAVLTGNTFPYLYGDATTFGTGGDFAWNVVSL